MIDHRWLTGMLGGALLWSGSAGATHVGDSVIACLIEPSAVVKIASEIPGIVDEISVDRGDTVREGQAIVRLRAGVEQAAVELARARLAFGQRKAIRNQELVYKQLISVHENDEIETENEIAELELLEAVERLKLRAIISPVSGVVIDRHVQSGEYVGVDPILSVARLDPLYVEVTLPVSAYGMVRKSGRAIIRPEAPVGGEYSGRVLTVDRVIDAASGTFRARIELRNPGGKLPGGLKCEVDLLH